MLNDSFEDYPGGEKAFRDFEKHFEEDSVVNRVVDKFQQRSAVGIKKYGVTLDRKDIDLDGWLEHLSEELMDSLLYIQKIKDEINNEY